MATSNYINQICVIGDKRKFISALINVDEENILGYAEKNGISYKSVEDLIKNKKIIKLIEREVEKKNEELASFESVKKIILVPEFTIENKLMTPTLKIKRNVIEGHYKTDNQ